MTTPELTVIVVSYNTRELTLAALRTLFEQTQETSMDVVVIDNASEDGSADAIAEAFPNVRLIRSQENHGFAKANNMVASEAKTDWLLLLNPDTEVHERAVDRLMAFAKERPSNGIYGGRTVFPDGRLNIASCWMKITPWSLVCSTLGLTAAFPRSEFFNPEAMGDWIRDTVREVDIVVGCFLLLPRTLWADLGGFNDRYFMYGEEADMCLRATARGYQPIINPEAEIMHIVGAASRTQAHKRILLAQARATLIRDHWPTWLVPVGLGLMTLWSGSRALAYRLRSQIKGTSETGDSWLALWQKRREWIKGYPELPKT